MISVEKFRIGGKNVWIATIHEEKIDGITFSLEKWLLEENLKRITGFLRRRGVPFDPKPGKSEYPDIIKEVIEGRLDNEDAFELLSFRGLTPFEMKVYEHLTKSVKRGSVITYGELARKLKTSPRAIGGAMKRNPYPIVVPCHRVVSSAGIGHYTPRLEEKVFLLNIEGVKRWTSSKRT